MRQELTISQRENARENLLVLVSFTQSAELRNDTFVMELRIATEVNMPHNLLVSRWPILVSDGDSQIGSYQCRLQRSWNCIDVVGSSSGATGEGAGLFHQHSLEISYDVIFSLEKCKCKFPCLLISDCFANNLPTYPIKTSLRGQGPSPRTQD